MATLDLCRQTFAKVSAYFMYLVPGLSFQERTLRYAERRWGVNILRIPGPALSLAFGAGDYAFPNEERLATPALSIADIEAHVREALGVEWIATGERKQDSLPRRGMLSACKGIDEERQHIYPLADWTNRDVCAYLKMRQIPMPPDYRLWGYSFGWFREEALVKIKQVFPDDYARILEVFPLAESVVKRAEFRERRQQVSDVHNGAGAPEPPTERAI